MLNRDFVTTAILFFHHVENFWVNRVFPEPLRKDENCGICVVVPQWAFQRSQRNKLKWYNSCTVFLSIFIRCFQRLVINPQIPPHGGKQNGVRTLSHCSISMIMTRLRCNCKNTKNKIFMHMTNQWELKDIDTHILLAPECMQSYKIPTSIKHHLIHKNIKI